jgi:REP element-mobilizing transposase RayT
MKYDPKIHHRRSIRLKGYDYSQSGAYFVTIVTWQRERLFGEIVDGEIRLNAFGEIVRAEWERTTEIHREVELGAFVVMPNHFHAIVIFKIDDIATVGADGRPPLPPHPPLRRQPRSLGSLMAGFKSTVTKQINTLRGTPKMPVWQRNYYEHLIRNADEANRIHLYIESNPVHWADDEENK